MKQQFEYILCMHMSCATYPANEADSSLVFLPAGLRFCAVFRILLYISHLHSLRLFLLEDSFCIMPVKRRRVESLYAQLEQPNLIIPIKKELTVSCLKVIGTSSHHATIEVKHLSSKPGSFRALQ